MSNKDVKNGKPEDASATANEQSGQKADEFDLSEEAKQRKEAETVTDEKNTNSDENNNDQNKQKSETDVLRTQVEALQKEVDAKNDQFLRKVAEFDNLKKRLQRERVQVYDDAKIEALKAFLPINDDLKRTLEASDNMEVDDKFLEGVQLVSGKFEEALQKFGIERIDETGVPFNVDIHEALMRQPAPDDDTESDMVIQILEPGYKMNNKVIRHAKVIVSQ